MGRCFRPDHQGQAALRGRPTPLRPERAGRDHASANEQHLLLMIIVYRAQPSRTRSAYKERFPLAAYFLVLHCGSLGGRRRRQR